MITDDRRQAGLGQTVVVATRHSGPCAWTLGRVCRSGDATETVARRTSCHSPGRCTCVACRRRPGGVGNNQNPANVHGQTAAVNTRTTLG